MKVSIITITKDDGMLLKRTIDSIRRQVLPSDVEIEHIIVNGSTPLSGIDVGGAKVLNRPPRGVYNALNEGILQATGDIIGTIHGNDELADEYVIGRIVKEFEKESPDFVYGNVNYIKASEPGRIFRHYSSEKFRPEHLLEGFAPPHPSLFISSKTMWDVGPYKENYTTGADFDLFIRLFLGKKKYNGRYMPGVTTNMECGGVSNTLYAQLVTNTREKVQALHENGLKVSTAAIACRFLTYLKTRN